MFMISYEAVDENIEEVGKFDGHTIPRPKYRCGKCSKAIKEEYVHTSNECYNCNNGLTAVGENVDRVFAISIYISDAEHTDLMEDIFSLKDEFENLSKFSGMLEWGVRNHDALSEFDLIVVPPSGESDSDEGNHMVPLGEALSERVDIPFADIIYKKEDYPSQKTLGLKDRLENLEGKIGCEIENLDANRVLVVDDIATSCATVSETARAVLESGATEAKGLVIARDENLRNLEFANVIKEKE